MGDTRKAVVGAFVVGGFLLFAVGLFLIGNRQQLFEQSFEVHADFERLAGLQNGAPVRVAGLAAGEVLEIRYPRSPAEPFRVRMRIIENLHPLVREDSVASIQTDGLVGNKLVEIEAGTDGTPMVEDEGDIMSQEPIDIAYLMDKASETADNLNDTILWARGKLDTTIENMEGVVDRADEMFEEVGEDVKRMSATGTEIAEEVEGIIASVRAGEGTVGKLLNDDEIYYRITELTGDVEDMSADARETFANVRAMSDRAREFVVNVEGDGETTANLVTDVRAAVASAREALSDLAENTESMKRSFLFRALFLERGYFDLDEITPAQYVRGALRDEHRSERFYIPADRLVDETPEGEEVLSERGIAEIRAAMRHVLRYPPTSPLMIEGYANEGQLDENYLKARRRAQLVHDYVVNVFHRDTASTEFITLESADIEQLAGVDDDFTGEGVVLALYYDEDLAPVPRPRVLH